jgi:hypothetical protein
MQLLFVTEANLRDRLFVKDLVHNFKFQGGDKALLIHEAPGGSAPARALGKYLSALFSECMVVNLVFAAGQRDLFVREETGFRVQADRIGALLEPVQLLIISPVIQDEPVPALELFEAARAALPAGQVTVFPGNPMSALAGRQRQPVLGEQDRDRLLGLYEEERPAIELAYRLRPATLASPVNYAH